MAKTKVGVVGIGSIANMFHLPNYKNHPEAELVAVADTDFERAKKVAGDAPGVTPYASAEEMFAKAGLNAVSICTFNESHVPLSLLALKHGLDVLVEKPMAMSVSEAELLKDAAQTTGRIVMVGMSHRYRADSQALQGIAAAGELGEIYYAKTKILRRRGVPLGWFTSKKYSGGGPMMDIGVHALDLVWWMMGKPEIDKVLGKMYHKIAPYQTRNVGSYEAMSSENKTEKIYDVEDLGSAFITFKNGASLTVEASWAVNGSQDDSVKVELYGTKGGASLDPFMVFKESNDIPLEQNLKFVQNDFYKEEIYHFIECVRNRKAPLSDAAQGCEVVKMLEAIRVSSETNDVVKL